MHGYNVEDAIVEVHKTKLPELIQINITCRPLKTKTVLICSLVELIIIQVMMMHVITKLLMLMQVLICTCQER
jgi:hypothetical protein